MNNMPMVAAVVVAFLVTAIMGIWLVPFLRRIKFGQTILDIGPSWHKSKQGTPTMGGIMFAIGISFGILVGFTLMKTGYGGVSYNLMPLDSARIILGLVMALGFGLIGFIDDYIKVVRKRNLGLSARQKLIMQFLISGVYVMGLYAAGDKSTRVFIPFLGQWNLGLLYYPLAILGIVYMINVVNFTDGIDGLCSSVTFIVALGFMGLSTLLHMDGMSMMSASVAGGCLGFLVWNMHPARIFMGDTGSMFLGGCVVALAFGAGMPAYLIFMGLIYIIEGLSVMIQTIYFKYTRRKYGEGRRLFKMSPIHHHFEKCGWSEGKIVVVFSIIQGAACLLSIWAATKI